MTPFGIALPGRVLFGRGVAAQAAGLVAPWGGRGLVVHGATRGRAEWLLDDLAARGLDVLALPCGAEPDIDLLNTRLATARAHRPDWVVGLGGGAVLDLAKALAALIPAPGGVMDHLEVVGRALPLKVAPLPFAALPTTAGTGAEATKNAVIGLPDMGRKVSLRDDRMLARLAIVDPALTDDCPAGVTLASGLDAITQVIEPFVSARATPFVDALTRPAMAQGMGALMRLMQGQDAAARDALAYVSLTGGIALANAGLGAVHGFAGVVGGMTGAAHGAICAALLPAVLAENRRQAAVWAAKGDAAGAAAEARLDLVFAELAGVLGGRPADAPDRLAEWTQGAGVPRLGALGLDAADHPAVVRAAMGASSMKGNPIPLTEAQLLSILAAAQ